MVDFLTDFVRDAGLNGILFNKDTVSYVKVRIRECPFDILFADYFAH